MPKEKIILPSPEEFFLNKSLYEKFSLGDEYDIDVSKQILDLEFFHGAIRTYCTDCKTESTFRTDQIKKEQIKSFTKPHIYKSFNRGHEQKSITPKEVYDEIVHTDDASYPFLSKTFTIEFYCTHNHGHRIFFTFNIKSGYIQKIGQFPSIADTLSEEVKIYKKILEKELGKGKSQEFTKAIGLYSHGVGIGSFVYLRRIFEAFIYQAKNEALSNDDIQEEDFIKARMVDKIDLLKEYLPEVIVENKMLYGVVSKGVHELSENECKEYFSIIKDGIELILDEKIAKRKAQEKKDNFKKNLSKAHQEILSKVDM